MMSSFSLYLQRHSVSTFCLSYYNICFSCKIFPLIAGFVTHGYVNQFPNLSFLYTQFLTNTFFLVKYPEHCHLLPIPFVHQISLSPSPAKLKIVTLRCNDSNLCLDQQFFTFTAPFATIVMNIGHFKQYTNHVMQCCMDCASLHDPRSPVQNGNFLLCVVFKFH